MDGPPHNAIEESCIITCNFSKYAVLLDQVGIIYDSIAQSHRVTYSYRTIQPVIFFRTGFKCHIESKVILRWIDDFTLSNLSLYFWWAVTESLGLKVNQ